MNHDKFRELISEIKVAKKLPDALYFHIDAFEYAPKALTDFILSVSKALKIEEDSWNLVKVFKREYKLSLLSYPEFFEESYPALIRSVTVDLVKASHTITQYDKSDNPPILHRKEYMIPTSHEHHSYFCMLTQEGENAGLYDYPRMIGFRGSWLRLIDKHGYKLVDGRLFRKSAVEVDITEEKQIDRHKTAIVRHELSAPMKSLAKHGYLCGEYTIFDYGCGRGDDLRELEAHGIDALGWDPNFRPDVEKVTSDIVNLGYVINVIEEQDERIEAIAGAWDLASKLLVVSAMLASESYLAKFTPYKDGVITSRNTFQKYYTQAELKAYIEKVVQTEAIAIAPGIYYVFKDKELECRLLQNRNKRHYQWQQKTAPISSNEEKFRLLFTQHSKLFESFWLACLAYGRCPANDEFSQSDEIITLVGSNKKALKLVCNWYESEEFETSAQMRREDLTLFFALEQFGQRKPYAQQEESLKRDIKAFFSNYTTAQDEAKELLFDIANNDKIAKECLSARDYLPAAKIEFEENRPHSLTLHKKFIGLLSPLLRIYINAGLQLYGELEDMQLVKIHINSGKLTLLGYVGFDDTPLPRLAERVKINMEEQDVDFFDYVDDRRRPLLLDKISFIDTSFDDYKKQKAFNKRLKSIFTSLSSEDALMSNMTLIMLNSLIQPDYTIKGYRFYR